MRINYNGKILPADLPIFKQNNRAFLYGDAFFETIRMFDGKLPFLKIHVNRLLQTLKFFKYKIPQKYTCQFFQKEIQKIANGNVRVRITFFRNNGGLYTPKNLNPKFLITTEPLKSSKFSLNKKGLKVDFFEEIKLPLTPISPYKTCNVLPYILAGIFKKEQNLNDCILLNDKGRIAESISSNLFLLKKDTLITPSLSEGCIDGTMRRIIFDIAESEKIKIREKKIPISAFYDSEEIWLTNAIQGIRWISKIGKFPSLSTPTRAQTFVKKINQKI